MPAIVLAGERPGGNALARELKVPAGALVEVAGQTCLERVIATLRASERVAGGILVGPARPVVDNTPLLEALLRVGDFIWRAPAAGPSASALDAAQALGRYPILLTAADHALLTAELVDDFCTRAELVAADLVVGLVPYSRVRAAWPESRRTALRFRDGACCGANIYLLRTPRAQAALGFWQIVEADRKRPWRIARRLGAGTLARYLAGRLDRASAFAALTQAAGAHIGWVTIDDPRAAVDVDSSADRALAEKILRHENDTRSRF
jgi:GTP:adenosylcobinamide-phosphate guanylyltransferase